MEWLDNRTRGQELSDRGQMIASEATKHNLGRASIRTYSWAGIDIRTIEQQLLPGRSWQPIESDNHTLSIVTRQIDGHCEPRYELDRALSFASRRPPSPLGHINLIPAGTRVWGYTEQMSALTETRLSLSPASLDEITGSEFPIERLSEPQLMLSDVALLRLGRLANTHCANGPTLLADSIVLAIVLRLAAVFSSRPLAEPPNGLSRRQLEVVTDFILGNLAKPIRLIELSGLLDLSPSQFCRSFKAYTGVTPHQWHLNARVERAKDLLEKTNQAVVDIALTVGFSDQSHLCRVFKAVTGQAPGQWRNTRP